MLWLSSFRVASAESTATAVPDKYESGGDTTTSTTTSTGTSTVNTHDETAPDTQEVEPERASHETATEWEATVDSVSNQSKPEEPEEEKPEKEEPQEIAGPETMPPVEASNLDNPALGKQQRLWGSPAPYDEDEYIPPAPKEEHRVKNDHDATSTTTTHHHNLHIPFVPKSTHPPPPGYQISARVYIDPNDKLGHIDDDPLTLPYWDCGAVGSTTSPLAVKEATFRHSLTPSQAWTGTDGKHPILAIALSEFLLEVSSGATKKIQPGQAILLEDVLIPGHRLKPINHHDVRVMFLTLPKKHYSTGKDQISISTTITNSHDPCPVPERMGESSVSLRMERDAQVLRVILGIAGLSLSTIAADFLGKTAPLWLAVGVGGTFFVVAGTVGTIALGEACMSNFQAWLQQKRLHADPVLPKEGNVSL